MVQIFWLWSIYFGIYFGKFYMNEYTTIHCCSKTFLAMFLKELMLTEDANSKKTKQKKHQYCDTFSFKIAKMYLFKCNSISLKTVFYFIIF